MNIIGPRVGKRELPPSAEDLRFMDLLRTLDADELAEVFACVKPIHLEASANVDFDKHNGVCLVWDGAFRLMLTLPADRCITLSTIIAGGHFGETSVFAEIPLVPYRAVAHTNGVLLTIEREQFRALVHEIPKLCHATLCSIAQAALLGAERVFEFATLDVGLRLQSELLRMAPPGRHANGPMSIKPAPTSEVLAVQIGATRGEVAQHLHDLSDHNIVSVQPGEILIRKPQQMRRAIDKATQKRRQGRWDNN